MTTRARPVGIVRALVFTWSLGGILLLLGYAIVRLSPRVAEAFALDLGPKHWIFAFGWTLFMLYTEAWRGFYKKFSPRAIARSHWVCQEGTPLQQVLAPVFAMAYFHSSRRRVIATWILTIFIVLMVIGIRFLDQPWRGLLDLGVVFGLGAGALTLAFETIRVHRGGDPVDPELP